MSDGGMTGERIRVGTRASGAVLCCVLQCMYVRLCIDI